MKQIKEIGGYIEFEHYHGNMLHEGALKLNSGRNCLAYLIKVKKIEKIAIPYFLCDCIEDVCKKYGTQIRYYHIGEDLLPTDFHIEEDEYLYLVNYYGQIKAEAIERYKTEYKNLILDNAHAYFDEPIEGVDALYTCRKYFGVPDGGILYTDSRSEIEEQDYSYDRIGFLAGRYEKTAGEFFEISSENEERFYHEPIRRMSKLTENILRSLDYQRIKRQRVLNMIRIHERLKDVNRMLVEVPEGTFMYPLMIDNASELREKLIRQKIYIPKLWPNVLRNCPKDWIEWKLANNILPLPIDQRYSTEDMDYIAERLFDLL